MTPPLERMSSLDAAWLHMDRRDNLMMIVGLVVFARPVAVARLRALLEERFLPFERFRQRPTRELGIAAWERDEHFDLDYHLQEVTLPSPGRKPQLQALVSRLASTPLDRARPLWQFNLVHGYRGGSAVVIRIHHAYADGIALVRVLLSMATRTPDGALPAIEHRDDAGDDGLPGGLRRALAVPGVELLRSLAGSGGRLLERGLERGLELAAQPEQAGALAQHALGLAAELGRIVALPDDPPTLLKGPLGSSKRAAWSDPLPLAEVRTVARALGCTINDVLIATVAGAVGSYLRERGEETDEMTLRANVPVNLRDPGAALELGNRFGIVLLDLPVGLRNPLERLYAVHATMKTLKDSYQPLVSMGLLAALGMLPGALENAAINSLSGKSSLVVSNVPGPQYTMYLAGGEMREVMFWVPQSGHIGLGISIHSYDGQVLFGVMSDRRRIPDPGAVVRRFAAEFEKLLLSVLLGPLTAPPG